MRRSLAAATVATVLSLASVGSTAHAQDASNQAAAQALFEQARQLMTEGKFAEACPKLAESERLDPGAGTLLNLGHCYEKNGQTASAWVTFKDAAAAADLKHRDDWSQRARERSAALEPTLSKLVIDVPMEARATGLQVRRDGANVGSAVWGVPIPTDPGDHLIEAVAPGKKKWSSTVKIGPKSDLQRVAVASLEDEPPGPVATTPTLAPPPATEPEARPASMEPLQDEGKTQRTAGLVLGGVGVAGVVVGSIFGVVALGKNSDAKDLCPNTACTNADGVKANDDAKSAATISTIGMIAGGALVAAGAVVYFTAPRAHRETALRMTPLVGLGANGIGAGIGGAW